jgi:hypothetical protein
MAMAGYPSIGPQYRVEERIEYLDALGDLRHVLLQRLDRGAPEGSEESVGHRDRLRWSAAKPGL